MIEVLGLKTLRRHPEDDSSSSNADAKPDLRAYITYKIHREPNFALGLSRGKQAQGSNYAKSLFLRCRSGISRAPEISSPAHKSRPIVCAIFTILTGKPRNMENPLSESR
jgi:hypothetical protein